jgi:8-oxo-dGTP pyrophosphatase MutT (NUDIX family)
MAAMQPVGWAEIRGALALRPAQDVADEVTNRAAVAVVLREAEAGLEILFIRRAEDPRDPWSGQMAFPGGRAEPGDQDLRATARRETHEEIGVDLDAAGEYLGRLDQVRAMARLRPMNLTITPFVFRLRGPAEPALSAEVRSLHWLDVDRLLDPARRSTMEYEHGETRLAFPCLRLDGIVIWGLTYRMFSSLGDRLAAVRGSLAGV